MSHFLEQWKEVEGNGGSFMSGRCVMLSSRRWGGGGVHRWLCFFVQKEVEGNDGVVS